jgi:sigma-B regulation protein RsbQ
MMKMSNASTDAVIKRYNIEVWGNGSQPMLFAHGLGCDQQIWHSITPAFEQDYKLIAFDYIGCGQSDLSAYDSGKYGALSSYAADLLDICNALGLQDIIFVGHSVSSMIGLLAAIEKPGLFKCLIMIGPSPCFLKHDDYDGGFYEEEIEELLNLMKKNYKDWAAFFAPRAMGNLDRPELYKGLRERFNAADPTITLNFARVVFYADNRKDLPKLKIPSLILQIPEDIIVPLSVGTYMHQVMPRSTLTKMNATGHFPHISAPQETVRVIKQYLASE